MMPVPSAATPASRCLSPEGSGAARPATGAPSLAGRNSAPWPPMAAKRSGAKTRSMSCSERPLTSASASPLSRSSRANVSGRPLGTRTSGGVAAMSRIVPSISSRKASSAGGAGSPGTMSFMAGLLALGDKMELPSARDWRQSAPAPGKAVCRNRRRRSIGRRACTRAARPRSSRTRFRRLAGPPPAMGSFHERQRPRHRFERPALRRDPPAHHDDGSRDHQYGAQEEAGENAGPRAGVDPSSEQQRAADAADGGTERVETRNGERPDFERKGLADGEIGGARSRRGEEKDHHPGDRLHLCRKHASHEQISADGEQDPGQRIGRGDYRLAADRIEQTAEQQRA